MKEQTHEFPLITNKIDKETAHGWLRHNGIRRPKLYDLGYPNNNCIGCVKGGAGYWNKIRLDFPDVFKSRCKLERNIGASCIKEIYLDELSEDCGNCPEPVVEDCGIFCELIGENK
jgi:hypothetical protein